MFFNIFGKKNNKKKVADGTVTVGSEEASKIVTEAVDPTTFSEDKVQEDLEALGEFDKRISSSEGSVSILNPVNSDRKVEQALKIENPFVGKERD
ncbi:MAG TPA: hypothetical protein ENN64_00555 [bacterium]|nr:hypothetical protein [bacterium]